MDYKELEKKIADKLDHMTTTTYMVPYWVEAIMALVKEWAEKELHETHTGSQRT